MSVGRKPTTKEFNEIVADMVRLYQENPNLMPDMCDRDGIVGHENFTDEQEARYWLGEARVVICDMSQTKGGFIFWGGECPGWPSVLVDHDGLVLYGKDQIEHFYWGTTG